jgi:branched-subunit amino acid transport protein
MGLATYLTRAPLLLILARRRLPDRLARYFAALPIALLTALAMPLVLVADGRLVVPWDPQVLGVLLVATLARLTGSLLLSVAAGVVAVAVLRALG